MTIKPTSLANNDTWSLATSPFQHREWVLWRMANGSSSRAVAAARKLDGPVDEKIVRRRLQKALQRHPVMRLAFDTEEPFASVMSDLAAPLVVQYARPGEDLAAATARAAIETAGTPFSLSSAPVLRAVLVRAGLGEAQEHALVLVAHPIIADESSLARLLEEIDANAASEEVDDAFLTWTTTTCSPDGQASTGRKLAFYRQLLNGAAFQMDLPTDRTRPPLFNPEGDFVEIEIPAEVQEAAEKLVSAETTSPAAIAIAALAAYLGRISRQSDIVLGLSTVLRPAGFESAIGPFENTTVLRVRLEDNPTGQGLIRQVRDSLAALEPQRDLPFEVLVEALQLERDPSRTPIFQVHFAHRVRVDDRAWLPAPTGCVTSDLDVVLEQGTQSLVLRLGYRRDIFQRDTVKHMAGHLVELLKALCERPGEPVNSLSVCTPQERDWILSTLGAQKNFSHDATIHGLVGAVAGRNPQATAVSYGDVQLSYGELNRRANQLAHRLRRLGVGRDTGVAVCMERSEELIIALLAILKAGGAYVPIEPANPKERIEFVLADSRVRLVLTEAAQKDKVSGASAQTIVLEPGGAAFAAELATDPEEVTDPDGLAYVIYTSGSTGRPKGVLIEHRNVVRLFQATHDWFRFDDHDVWTMFHSVAFDFSVWEIWGALIYGGRVVIVPYLVSRSPVDFYKLLVREKVTILNQTPSAFRQLIQAEAEVGQRESALRHVVFGGEALEFESLRPWFERHGDQFPRLVNMYGITETCVHVTYRPVSMKDLDGGRGASIIGVPIPDLSTYVVDETLQLLPPGIPGELVVGGAGLARGYLERPELTAERFVPDPFSKREGARLYRSGDLVRLLPTGELDYLGRIDLQVKIRGFRIETGEVEAVLRRSGLLRDVAVVPWQRAAQETQLIAYVVSDQPVGELRQAARTSLPEYMVPTHFVAVPAIPMTANGKVDRKALPDPQVGGAVAAAGFAAPSDGLERIIAEVWCEVLGVEQVSSRESFFDIGGTSLGVVRVASKLKERLGRPINIVTLFQYPSVAALAKHFAQTEGRQPTIASFSEKRLDIPEDEPIALVGMAGRFPSAPDVASLWDLLVSGKEAITFFSANELDPSLDPALVADPAYVKARGVLEGAELFDASFFGISPREAEVTDPQQRVLLEVAWEALEHAGYDSTAFPGLIAVYAGVYNNTYYLENVLKRPDVLAQVGAFQAMACNEKDFVAMRIAHRLDLKGPAISIHTACSTSLVAVANAFYALRTHQCDVALAGAAAITCPQRSGYLYQEGGMLSPDGHTRPFDERANGTVFCDGVGMVVLRRLSDALAAGDTIYAVIRGAATNNDGGEKMSFSAPKVEGQADVITKALAVAGVHPETISYIEAHGTATPLGDPIEVAGLKQAFDGRVTKHGFCALGSIKSNLGHLTAAAGVAGLIKAALSLDRELVPPTLGFIKPNPEIVFDGSPFFVAAELRSWPRRAGEPRRAGVSSFGVGGTNAHVVIEEAPPKADSGASRPQQLLVLSAKTDSALQAMTANLAAHLEADPGLNLADVAFTLQSGRKLFAHRRAVVASGAAEAVDRLRSLEVRSVVTGKAMAQAPSIVFLFPGQGAQYLDMGRELYEGEPVFREEVDRCAEILRHHLDLDLRTVLYPEVLEAASVETQINQTCLAQPAIFVVEYALARLWMSWGVKPSVMIGHSIGEYVAAVLAETFTLEDALALLSVRARLMQALPAGSMIAVRRGVEEIEPILPAGASIAAINSPVLCTVSGPTEALQNWQEVLESKGIAARILHTSHAFHSAMMDPMLPEFAAAARQVPSRPPKLPWVSTCTGEWMSPQEPVEGDYWVRQIRQTVRFATALEAVIEDPRNLLLEVGPGQTLTQLARQHTKKLAGATMVATLGPVAEPGRDLASMLAALGRLWVAGVSVDWKGFSATEQRKRVPLPTYPFERKRYWIEPNKAKAPIALALPTPDRAPITETAQTKEPEMQIAPVAVMTATPPRKERLINELRGLFQSYSGSDHSQTDEKASFIDLGFDSLFLTQAAQGVQKRFGVKVTFRQMLGDLGTLESLTAFLDAKLPPDALPQPPAPTVSAPASPAQAAVAPAAVPAANPGPPRLAPSVSGSLVETVIQQQMALMTQQLELLRQAGATGGGAPAPTPAPVSPGAAATMPVVTAVNLEKQSHFGPFKAIEKGSAGGLTQRQQKALDALVARYNRRTAKSKALAQQHRAYFCDPRAAGNFRQLWKEMVYPIMCAKSKGSRIWDIDGNEYIDVTMGFGANYLGHSPDFVMQALEEQMKLGVEIGPQSPIAGEVAKMICEFTGMDRATFCNTGSEAVMAAFRVARTVTGREKIVYFYGDYHGVFDEVLGRPALFDGVPGAMPIAPGIPHLANIIILEYGNPSSLDAIRQHASEIAGVIVEPVQSRHPGLQPREFLQELRRITQTHEIALIFDEVITGFRIAPGGAQEYFGVKADMATYGKVVGGGMPIGVLAGSAMYMDALDGGFWQYGDDSSPPTGVTFFAGTFVRHPLAMAAAYAVLKHLKSAGPSLQEQANKVTARFVDKANEYFSGMQLPMQLQKFSTTFYYDFHSDLKYAGLLFYYLRDRGIHIWEGRVGHLSIAHTEQDMDRTLLAFQESVEEMQAGGFLPESGLHSAARGDRKAAATLTEVAGAKPAAGRVSADANRFPLAEAQREMWIGAQMRPEAAGPHHACTGLYLDGELDVELLRRAILAVVQRHEGLRCTFSEDGTEAVLHPSLMSEVPVHDLSRLPEPQRAERVNEILHQEGRRLLDLTQGPLVDFQILKLSAQRHMLILTAQMIVCDGWAHYVVFEDLGAIYTALAGGREPSLTAATPMREYALWEQANAASDEARECEDFWVSRFETVPAPIDFPTSRPRPPARTFEGARRELTLPAELCRNIKRLGKEQKNSYFAVLLAAFQVWVHRLSGARDVVVGVPFAAQSQLGMDTLVGQCANILPLRAQLDPAEAFSSVLKNTWSAVLDAQEHWNFTYGRLLPRLDLPRDSSRIPLVSVLFNIDPQMAKVKFGGLKHRFITGPRYYFQYDLGFNLVESEDTISVECDYNRNLFDGDVVQLWVDGYRALLETVVQKPDQPVGRLPMMNESEARRLVSNDSSSKAADVSALTVDALFKAQVARAPEAIAATAESGSLTYRELDQRSSRLGNFLVSLGVGPDTAVGVCVDRSLDLPVALLAILKAGGAYVLIDPAAPGDDVLHMVNDSAVSIILVDDRARSKFPATAARVVHLNEAFSAPPHASDALPIAALAPDRLACIIYKPYGPGRTQGVEITHRGLVNCLLSMQRELRMVPEDGILCYSPASCGLEIIELWLPLATGARTVISPSVSALDPAALCRVIEKQNVTAMLATPSVWRMLLNSGWQGNKGLKALCRGEALRPELAERLAKICKDVWNLYGTAETTLVSMTARVQAEAPVTLGRPIDNVHVVLTDEQFEPVPVGVGGEILIAGSGLARGYRNLPALEAEKFINRSIGGQSPVRFFRSGDLARYRPDGGIEFLGRLDRQAKARGFHFEPGDVEAILQGHSAVRDAVVSLRDDIGGGPGFVAYILLGTREENAISFGTAELIKELRRLVRSRLPEYMLPARFAVIEAIPRTPDGRVDHAALPAPTEADNEFEDYVAPRNKTEEILAGIWQELLKLAKVSVKDNFFDLGGQSLMAVRLFNRIEQEFGRRFPLAMLFRAPTIDQLARKLTADEGPASAWPSLVAIQPHGSKAPLFLAHGAGGNVLLYRALAKRLEPDYPLYGLQSQGLDGQSKPLQTIEEMADRYLQEIRTVQPTGPYLLGGYCLGGTVAYEMAQRLVAGGEKVAMVAMLDTYNFSRALKASFFSFLMQKFRFHWGNFVRLRPGIMWRYLREKKRIAGDGGWSHIRTEMPGTTLQDGVARAESGIEADVQEMNDHAADIYDPKPYSGVLTLFKPHINYKFYPDPKLGWGDLALGGLDIVEMPFNPHAMLAEPYVELLARELKTRLERLGLGVNRLVA